jgi:hypothetical protein
MRITPLIILCFCAFVAHAQSYLTLSGKIVDQNNNRPLAYAHVGVPTYGIGTTSGIDGSFVLKIPVAYQHAQLVVSYIGYESFKRRVDQLNTPQDIKLKASATSLQEIIVMDESKVEDIIRRAVNAIPQNYGTKPSSMLAFYREARTDANQEYLYLAEGVLNIYKTSYKSSKEGQTGLVQGRKIILQPDTIHDYTGFTAGHLAAHRFDFVKHREDFINEDYFDAYQYRLESVTTYQGMPVYVIAFDQAGENSRGRLEGKVYIDTLNYAFIRADFKVKEQGLKKVDDYPLYSGRWKGNRYFVNYKQLPNGKWYFNDALREGHYRDGGIYTNEVVITEINQQKAKVVPYIERLQRNSEFLEITGRYDEDFWKQYNTSPLNDRLYQSLSHLKNQALAEEVFDSIFLAQLSTSSDSLANVEVVSTLQPQPVLPREEDIIPSKKGPNSWIQWEIGLGVHALENDPANYEISFQPKSDAPALVASGDLSSRPVEVIYQIEGQLFFARHFFFNWGFARDFWDSYYRERGVGFGAQVNVSKGRPVLLRGSVQHSKLQYARLIDATNNEAGTFNFNGTRFNADEIRLYYGNMQQSLKFNFGIAIELNPSLEIFAKGSYLLPYIDRPRVLVREKGDFNNRKTFNVPGDKFMITRDDTPFNGRLSIDQESLMLVIGLVRRW